jgi:hypothetical protein
MSNTEQRVVSTTHEAEASITSLGLVPVHLREKRTIYRLLTY